MAVFPLIDPIFDPAIRQIAALNYTQVGNRFFILVTTTVAHKYKTGNVIRFSIPIEFGAFQLDQLNASIFVTTPIQFVVNFLNDKVFLNPDPFVIPATPKQAPLVIPIAEDVDVLSSAEHNVLP